MLKADPSV